MSTGAAAAPIGTSWWHQSRVAPGRASMLRAREAAKPIALSAVAAAVAWLIAHRLVGHAAPFFAPVAAVIVVGLTVGERASRALELVVGQALGILCADLLVGEIGTGAAQVGVVVALAMVVAVLIAPGTLLAQQAAISGVLVAVLQRPGSGCPAPASSTRSSAAGWRCSSTRRYSTPNRWR